VRTYYKDASYVSKFEVFFQSNVVDGLDANFTHPCFTKVPWCGDSAYPCCLIFLSPVLLSMFFVNGSFLTIWWLSNYPQPNMPVSNAASFFFSTRPSNHASESSDFADNLTQVDFLIWLFWYSWDLIPFLFMFWMLMLEQDLLFNDIWFDWFGNRVNSYCIW